MNVLTEAVVARLGVIIVTILADLVKVFQVRVSVELGHFLYCSKLRFNNAEEGEGNNCFPDIELRIFRDVIWLTYLN